VGRVLGDRYRLVAPIGAGASAMVFLAEDVTLKRQVAVKLLHEGLTDDQRFLERFRSEAQTAASLNHPHVMAVHDWGFDGVPYLVTEYLAGGSLQAMLEQGHRLTPSQALMVGLEASRALEYTHRRGLVHRDIKPSNLLFDEDGRMRIADFGLARALAEASVTEPTGAVLGSVRYASPEQARGESVGERADLYALGLVLIEAVTGRVPFATDTALGTLMARLDDAVEVPEELAGLTAPVARLGKVLPLERPDAEQFSAMLLEAAPTMTRPEPLPLVGATAGLVADPSPTDLGGPAKAPPMSADGLMDAPRGLFDPPEALEAPGTVGAGTEASQEPIGDDADSARVVAASSAAADTTVGEAVSDQRDFAPTQSFPLDQGSASPDTGRRQPLEFAPEDRAGEAGGVLWILAGLAIVVALAGGMFLLWRNSDTPLNTVPDVVGEPFASVENLIAGNDWEVVRLDGRQTDAAVGSVIRQSPEAGRTLAGGGEFRVTVSIGNEMVEIPPQLTGATEEEAAFRLAAVGLEVGQTTVVADEDAPSGTVISVLEPLFEVPMGDAINLEISGGPVPRTVPTGLVGKSIGDVTTQLEDLRLVPEVTRVFNEESEVDRVLEVSIEGGTEVPVGTVVAVVVSDGPEPIEVPDVVGLPLVEAQSELGAVDLCLGETFGSSEEDAEVLDQSPVAGAIVLDKTECVDLVTSISDAAESG